MSEEKVHETQSAMEQKIKSMTQKMAVEAEARLKQEHSSVVEKMTKEENQMKEKLL